MPHSPSSQMDKSEGAPALTPQDELALARETIAALTDQLCEATRTIDEMVENCPAVVHIKGLDGKFIQVNKMFEEIVGLPRAAVIGRTVFEIYPPALAGSAHERDLEVIRSAQQMADETVIGQGATRRVFLDVKFPLFDAAGAVRATAGIATEITAQKLMEESLVKLANTDVLTGLANRRCFFENLAQEFNRSRRYAHRLTVIALDLDHFKQINDRHGHASGDIVLKKVAELFVQAMRSTDVVGRIGGEEFAILMPEAGAIEAAEVAERLRCMVAGAVIVSAGGEPLQVTASMGATCMRAADTNYEEVLERADKALYKAKHEGRNRVCFDA